MIGNGFLRSSSLFRQFTNRPFMIHYNLDHDILHQGSMGESDQVRGHTSSVWTSKQWNCLYIVTTCPLPLERKGALIVRSLQFYALHMFPRHMEPLQRWYATIYCCMPPPRGSIEYGGVRICGEHTRLHSKDRYYVWHIAQYFLCSIHVSGLTHAPHTISVHMCRA